ncbi:hypothetical protein Afil01_27370 [Actinorhabdospora filicis]|uniref:histidine kinase n=1 Tax=Actinorhabdospora filicis TaxID=1785913 RepID=A0A9W6WAR8_9ACTN|nr:histidine kinase [Actinorhabdospora filicis]GLZ77930.1 hypothetical protein Afil01_27370 [Actinorhabdospora filicis]
MQKALRRAGRPVAAVVLAVLAVVEVLPLRGSLLALGLLVAVCATVPLAVSRRPVIAAIVATAGTGLSVWLLERPVLGGVVASLVAWALVAFGRWRSARKATVAREAARREMERSLVQYTALGERARIARELHDVVAHHISMISVQAETARLTTPGMPDEGARRLLAIGETARTALTEMRRLLGVLREEGEVVPDRAPQPGLDQLLDLVDDDRAAGGGRTRLIVSGPPTVLSAGAELAAYRVVQESLTNARKYAPGAAVDVEIVRTGEGLRLRVRDNGPGPGGGAPGLGLLGMRERVAAVGGSLRTGPSPMGGFVVEASIPGERA